MLRKTISEGTSVDLPDGGALFLSKKDGRSRTYGHFYVIEDDLSIQLKVCESDNEFRIGNRYYCVETMDNGFVLKESSPLLRQEACFAMGVNRIEANTIFAARPFQREDGIINTFAVSVWKCKNQKWVHGKEQLIQTNSEFGIPDLSSEEKMKYKFSFKGGFWSVINTEAGGSFPV